MIIKRAVPGIGTALFIWSKVSGAEYRNKKGEPYGSPQ